MTAYDKGQMTNDKGQITLIAVDTSIRTFGTIVETRHGASLHK